MERHKIVGVQVHDAYLVALMTVYGISHILTQNARDFARFKTVTAVAPRELIAAE